MTIIIAKTKLTKEIVVRSLYLRNFLKSRKFHKKRTSEEPFYRKPYRKFSRSKDKPSKPKRSSLKDVTCYKCGKKGHISKYCKVFKKIQKLDLEDETMAKLSALFIETSESENISVAYPQIDEIATISSSEPETESSSKGKHLNILTKEQTIILDVIQHINEPDIQKKYLE